MLTGLSVILKSDHMSVVLVLDKECQCHCQSIPF